MKIIESVPPTLDENSEVAVDTEIFGMEKGKLHRPTGHFASMQMCFDGKTVYVVKDEKLVQECLDRIKLATHIFHNASFDIYHIRRWARYDDNPKMVCTLLLEKILWGGYYDSFGLKDLVRRYLSIYLDKKEREEFVTQDELTPKMLTYAAQDALYTWKIFQEQKKLITPESERIWKEIDQPALYAVMDFKGMNFDTVSWKKIADTAKAKVDELAQKHDFNPNSSSQALKVLHDSGLRKLTDTNAKSLLPYREYPLVQHILDYRENYKKVSTYGEKFIKEYVEEDGKIYPEFTVTEALTGRMSSSNPNAQNIPGAKEYRSCFISSKGNVILVADYSAQEPRITAAESKDQALTEVVKSGNVHMEVGKRIFKTKSIPKGSKLYKKAKALNLGLTYGMTAKGLFININNKAETKEDEVTLEEAQELINQYFNNFWGVKQWIDEQRKFAQKYGYVQSRAGRRVWINRASYHWSNNSINCLDADTEALTQRGWIKGFELTLDDVLLTKNPNTLRLEWQKIDKLNLYPDYEGEVVEFKNKSFNCISTLNHRWLVTTKWGEKTNIKTTKDLSIHGDDRIHRTGIYFPNIKSSLTPDEAELLGWFVTDGYIKPPNQVTRIRIDRAEARAVIVQSLRANPNKCARIDALLNRLGEYKRNVSAKGTYVTWTLSRELSRILVSQAPKRTLTMDTLLKLDRVCLERLQESMLLGDGCLQKQKTTLCTGRKEQADNFQILSTLTGNATSLIWRDMSKYEPKLSEKMKNSPRSKGIWKITILRRDRIQVTKSQRKQFKAKIPMWCPTVPNSFFVARRSGHIFITGNSPIQGGAADVTKLALSKFRKACQEKNLSYPVIAVVHDEIVCDVPETLKNTYQELLTTSMISVAESLYPEVKFALELASGANWGCKA